MRKKLLIGAAVLAALLLIAVFVVEQNNNINIPTETPSPTVSARRTLPPELESDLDDFLDGLTAEPSVTVKPTASSKPETTLFGTLEILGTKINIADNVDEKTLDKQPGHLPSSALPGEDGMSVILGHRNSRHLRVLEKVKVGDEIKFTYADGRSVVYSVSEVKLYKDNSNYTLPIVEGKSIVLVTCYPFRYSGHAPGKAVVLGSQK